MQPFNAQIIIRSIVLLKEGNQIPKNMSSKRRRITYHDDRVDARHIIESTFIEAVENETEQLSPTYASFLIESVEFLEGFELLSLLERNDHLSLDTYASLLSAKMKLPLPIEKIASSAKSAYQNGNMSLCLAILKTRPEVLLSNCLVGRKSILHFLFEDGFNDLSHKVMEVLCDRNCINVEALLIPNQRKITPLDLLTNDPEHFMRLIDFLRYKKCLYDEKLVCHLLYKCASYNIKDLYRELLSLCNWNAEHSYTTVLRLCCTKTYHARGDNYLPQNHYPRVDIITFVIEEGVKRKLLPNDGTFGMMQVISDRSALEELLEGVFQYHHSRENERFFHGIIKMCFDVVGVKKTVEQIILSSSTLMKTKLFAPKYNFNLVQSKYSDELRSMDTQDMCALVQMLYGVDFFDVETFIKNILTEGVCMEKLRCQKTGRSFLIQAIVSGMKWNELSHILKVEGTAIRDLDEICGLPLFLMPTLQKSHGSNLSECYKLLRMHPEALLDILR